MKKAVDT